MDFQNDFPILKTKVNGHPLIYFDNAATSQKPKVVIDKVNDYYQNLNSNVHRGVHELSQIATNIYEESRVKIQHFIGAENLEEIIFTKGTTDGINIVPWQILCEKTGAKLIISPISNKGELILEDFKKLLSPKTKLIAISHVSNTLGTINPIEEVIKISKEYNCKILIDAAQSVPHFGINVSKLNCDFLVFSGHKIFAPTGTGILYVKKDRYTEMKPYQGGGDMIKEVSFEKTTFNSPPHKFEAGTPNIAGIIGLGAAIDYVNSIGIEQVNHIEEELLKYATEKISSIKDIKIYGNAEKKASVISFNLKNSHPFDVGTLLDQMGIAIRTGHHCTQPLMDFYNIPGTARVSFAYYNKLKK